MKIILIILALIVAGFLVQTGIYVYKIKTGKITDASFEKELTSSKNLSGAESATPKTNEIINITAPSYGAADPKLTIIEFGNFACPHSKEVSAAAREIMLKNKETVKFIYRDFPLDDIYPSSSSLSLAGKCANEQNKFWAMHDKLYQASDVDIETIANQIGLDYKIFSSCVSQKKYLSSIQKDFEDGYKNGVTGTPVFFFIKKGSENAPIKIPGAIPKATFEEIVKELLK